MEFGRKKISEIDLFDFTSFFFGLELFYFLAHCEVEEWRLWKLQNLARTDIAVISHTSLLNGDMSTEKPQDRLISAANVTYYYGSQNYPSLDQNLGKFSVKSKIWIPITQDV